MTTIQDVRMDLEQVIGAPVQAYLPQVAGYGVEVDIIENHRKKRSDAAHESWRPEIGEIRIRFVVRPPIASPSVEPQRYDPQGNGALHDMPCPSVKELVESLSRAESRPGYSFVSIKWFRDKVLPAEGYAWVDSYEARSEALREAIEDGVILTSKVPNPNAPTFPVTAIRLNRGHPDVVSALGSAGTGLDDFAPVEIRGEPLSATVIRERR